MTKALFSKGFKANLHPFVWGVVLLFCFIGIKAKGQTIYDWDIAAPDGNWRQGAAGVRWTGGLFNEPPNATGAILRFNNNTFTTMTNNAGSSPYSIHQIIFGTSANASRSISGTSVQFFEFGATWPLITNQSIAIHSISFPITASSNSGFNLELIANSGPLIFSGTVNNNGRNLMIYGNSSLVDGINRFIRLSGVVSGAGGLTISQLGVARLNAAHTFSGTTQIDNGELWIESAGSILNSSATNVGNAGQTGNTAKIWLSNVSGNTTFSNSLTINQGNAGTREIGGLNTSGTHTFSGTITNNSTNGLNLRTPNAGGTTDFTGVISGTNPINILGAGVVRLTGNNTYTGATAIQTGATLQLGIGGANTPLGTTAAGTTVNSGGVLDLNGFTIATTEALTLNGTGISSGGALLNSSATAATIPGAITLGSASSINTTGNITTTGIISGANSLTKIGNGTLILSAANTYSGGTTISAGTLELSVADNRLPTTGSVTLANVAGAVLNLNNFNQTIGTLTGGGAIGGNVALGSGNLTTGNASSTTFSGIISGSGGLMKEGAGTFTLAAANTFTGTIAVNNGILRLNTVNAVPASNAININNSAGITFGSGVSGNVALGSTQCITTLGSPSINFESSASVVNVTFSNFAMSGSSRLTITGWTPSGNKRIFINSGFMPTGELDRIDFDGYGVGAKINTVTNELTPKFLYVTLASGTGNFNNPTSWVNGDNPNINDGTASILIQGTYTLTQNVSYNLFKVEVAVGASLTVAANTITIFAGGELQNNGTVNMSNSSAVINMQNNTTWSGAGSVSGSSGTVNFLGAGTVTGTVTFPNVTLSGGAVNFGTASTINGASSLTISGTGSIATNAPFYASGSTLIYNRTITRGAEWNTGTIGQGVPHNVQVNNTFTLTLGDGTTAFRQCNGNLTLSGALTMGAMTEDLIVAGNVLINSTGTLTLGSIVGAIAGDIFVGADWQQNTLATFNPNQRAVIFNGTPAVQNITAQDGLESFGYLIINKNNDGTVRFASGTNAEVNGTNSGFPLQLLNGNLDLNGNTFTFRTYNTTLHDILIDRINPASSLTRNISNSSGTTANFIFTHGDATNRTATVTRNSATASLLSFASNIVVQIGRTGSANSGVNFGAGITTINGTLQINTGGFVITNAPTYATGSLLRYNSGGNYNRTTEWSATAGPGYPFNVQVSNSTSFSPGGTTAPTDFRSIALNLVNDLTIDANSSFDMSGGGANMTLPLIVGRDIIITGNLDGSTNPGSGIQVGRHWTRNTGGTFTHNTRAVTFNSAQNSNLTAPTGGETFHILVLNKSTASNTLTLQSQLVILNSVTFTSGLVVTTNTNLFIMNSGSSVTGANFASRISGASDNSFVSGPMKKNGNTDFLFPVGKPLITSPAVGGHRFIGISGLSASDEFTAEFFTANASLIGPIVSPAAPQLVRVSGCEYWRLDRAGLLVTANVTLSWAPRSKCNVGAYVTNPATIVVAHNTSTAYTASGYTSGSGNWDSYGNSGGTTGLPAAGSVTWNAVSTFSPFALGSINQADNPLPFVLLNFEGKQVADGIDLRFKVKGNNEQREYVIEKSNNGIVFTAFKTIAAKANLTEADYNVLDEQPVSGWNYYRLTAKSLLGETKQSQIIRIWFGQGTGKPAVYPNPIVNNQINLSTNGLVKGIYNLQVLSVDGKQMIQNRWVFDGTQAIHSILLNQSMSSGIYWLVLSNQNQEVVRIKIYK